MSGCTRCERESCCAEEISRVARQLGFPENMRDEVTAEQDECDRNAKKVEVQP